MTGKQIITDILVVIVFPFLLVWGYYSFKNGDGALLSFVAPMTVQSDAGGQNPGVKTTDALVLLRSIPGKLNQSLFSDPAYLMLKDYRVSIPTIPLGRSNPFTPSPALENLSRLSRTSAGAPVQEVVPTSSKLNK